MIRPIQPLTPVPIRQCPRCGYTTHIRNEDEEFDLIVQNNAEKALEIDELKQQRDELLAALEAVRADLVMRAEMEREGGVILNIGNGVLRQMDAAIAKVNP